MPSRQLAAVNAASLLALLAALPDLGARMLLAAIIGAGAWAWSRWGLVPAGNGWYSWGSIRTFVREERRWSVPLFDILDIIALSKDLIIGSALTAGGELLLSLLGVFPRHLYLLRLRLTRRVSPPLLSPMRSTITSSSRFARLWPAYAGFCGVTLVGLLVVVGTGTMLAVITAFVLITAAAWAVVQHASKVASVATARAVRAVLPQREARPAPEDPADD